MIFIKNIIIIFPLRIVVSYSDNYVPYIIETKFVKFFNRCATLLLTYPRNTDVL